MDRMGYVRINVGGGIYAAHTVEDFRTKLVNVREITQQDLEIKSLFLEEKSNFLILENDPKLDPFFNNYLKDKGNYSYILNLRNVLKK